MPADERFAEFRAALRKNNDSAHTDNPTNDDDDDPRKPWPESLVLGSCTSLELNALQIIPRKPVIADWCLVGDLGFIFAPRGLGKTWLTLHLAHGIATGAMVGPWPIPREHKVLYLDGEMPPQDIQLRDRELGAPTTNLIYINHQLLFDRTSRIMNLGSFEFQAALLDHCVHEKIDVLCLDNLSCLASGIDENIAIDWEKLQSWLLKLRRLEITVIFIHHAGTNASRMRGTSKREDPAAWILRLDPPAEFNENAGAHFVTRFVKWRSQKQPQSLEWAYEPNGRELVVNVKDASPLVTLRTHIENGLDTCTMIAEEMGVTNGYVSQLAKHAMCEGWLRKNGRKYEISDDPF